MEHDKRTLKRKLGDLGENIASSFLVNRGYKILDRNYLKAYGELDIIASRNNVTHFIEVKSVSHVTTFAVTHVTPSNSQSNSQAEQHGVTHGTLEPVTQETEGYRPEDNIHPQKLKRIYRTAETYLAENNIDGDWQLDIITVKINEKSREARVEIIENIVG